MPAFDGVQKSIILLSGPVRAGKTTVARELVAAMPGPVACIEGDTFWCFIAKGPKLPTPKTFGIIMASMTAAAVPYAVAGYDVIVDFSIPPWFLDAARRIAAVRNVPIDYVVLRPDEDICAARAAARSEGTIEDYRRYSDLYAAFLSFPDAAKHTISGDSGTPAAIARLIRDGLSAGKFRLAAPPAKAER